MEAIEEIFIPNPAAGSAVLSYLAACSSVLVVSSGELISSSASSSGTGYILDTFKGFLIA
jgi:hypothetical protein